MSKEIEELEKRLRNNPQGIPHSKLPKEPHLIEYMKQLRDEKKAIWLRKEGEWYYIRLTHRYTEAEEPFDKYPAPLGIVKWIWEGEK